MNNGIIKKLKRKANREETEEMIIDALICVGFIVAIYITYIVLWVIAGKY